MPSGPGLWQNPLLGTLLVRLYHHGKQKFLSLMQLYLSYKLDLFPGS